MAESLLEALKNIQENSSIAEEEILHCALFCGYTPLYLKTFFHSSLCKRLLPKRKIELHEGIYGDLLGSLMKLLEGKINLEFAAVLMEWEDFDPRLGLRSNEGWSIHTHEDILATLRSKTAFFADCLERLTEKTKVILSLPHGPFLPLHSGVQKNLSTWEWSLKHEIYELPKALLSLKNFNLLNDEYCRNHASFYSRYCPQSHLAYGFPYSLDFASFLAQTLAEMAFPSPPLKGIIVDLDETLWKGILGENGVEGVSWDLESNSHIHGVFQAFLQSLAESGVLIAVASKNNQPLVEELFSQRATLLQRESIYPLLASWGRKSDSVRKILDTWNIGAADVAFVDDSPLEIEEVCTMFPEIRSFIFPSGKTDQILVLIHKLRNLFGKDRISNEDAIRLQSLKQRAKITEISSLDEKSYDQFLRMNQSKIFLHSRPDDDNGRALELINKTNQFNMNGKRCTENDWKNLCNQENGFVISASYEDKFGPLGKIAVMVGFSEGRDATLTHWVMSCRAFGRRIEHCMLKYVFEKFNVEKIRLQYLPTLRNSPFLEAVKCIGAIHARSEIEITHSQFAELCPNLYHTVKENQ